MLLITGSRGQLGTTLRALLPEAVAAGSDDLDITDEAAVRDFVRANNISCIINCAAYTAVDKAEDEPERARAVNATGPANLAKSGAAVIHISTDYVFDGASGVPYTEDMPVNPLSVYGKTKLQGEREVLDRARTAIVIRTSWLYSPYGSNFVKTMLRLGAERDCVRVVADQTGTPTSCLDLARAVVAVVPRLNPGVSGIYHYSGEGSCSWYEFAAEIMRLAGLSCRVEPIEGAEYPARAARPRFSVFDKTKIKTVFDVSAPYWKDSLRQCISAIPR